MQEYDLYGYDLLSHEKASYSLGDFNRTILEIMASDKETSKIRIHVNHKDINYLPHMVRLVEKLGVNNILPK